MAQTISTKDNKINKNFRLISLDNEKCNNKNLEDEKWNYICKWNVDDNINLDMTEFMKRTQFSKYPLLEYNDPINLCKDYETELIIKIGVNIYGNTYTKKRLFKSAYKSALLDLLNTENIDYLNYIESATDATEFLEKLSESLEIPCEKYNISASDIMKVTNEILKEKLINSFNTSFILAKISINTEDKWLKETCEDIINENFTETYLLIKETILEKTRDLGLEKIQSESLITNQILKTPLSQKYNKVIKFAGSAAQGISMAFQVVEVKDIITSVLGVDKMAEEYLNVLVLDSIYYAACKSYGELIDVVLNEPENQENLNKLQELFSFVLRIKKNQYDSMQAMFSKSKINKIKDSDNLLKTNIKNLSNITITNYKKSTLKSLVPSVLKKYDMEKGKTYALSVSNLRYGVKVTRKSSNKNIVTVDKNGKITAKKNGTATITTIVNQNNKKYSFKTIVNVANPTIKITTKKSSMHVGDTFIFRATKKGISEDIVWSVSNKKLATINSKTGKLTAKKAGTVTITAKTGKNKISVKLKIINLSKKEIYNKLVKHYKKGTKDGKGSELIVMEGEFINKNQYNTSVRCGIPGNLTATQILYDILVNLETGDVTQTRVLTDNEVIIYSLYNS